MDSSRVGARWTENEETQLIEELKQGKNIIEIADIHNRQTGGILSRIKKIIFDMHLEGMTNDEISENLCIENEMVIETIDQFKHKMFNTPTKDQAFNFLLNEIHTINETLQQLNKNLLKIKKRMKRKGTRKSNK